MMLLPLIYRINFNKFYYIGSKILDMSLSHLHNKDKKPKYVHISNKELRKNFVSNASIYIRMYF